MNNNEYLNEERYQKTSRGVNRVGLVLFIIGGIMALAGIILVITGFLGFGKSGSHSSFASFVIGGFLLVFGFALAGFGGQMLFIGHGREIAAFTTQQSMPVRQEAITKMAPTVGQAAGTIARDVAAGIREGLNNNNNDNNSNNDNNQ